MKALHLVPCLGLYVQARMHDFFALRLPVEPSGWLHNRALLKKQC